MNQQISGASTFAIGTGSSNASGESWQMSGIVLLVFSTALVYRRGGSNATLTFAISMVKQTREVDMSQFRGKLILILVAGFLFAGNVNANPAGSGKSAPAIVADVFICRPLGLLALIGGSALYVISLPCTIPADGTEEAKRTLIMYPYHYTFTRQLGEFHDEDL